MKRKTLLNVAASSMIVASTMVGCSGAALHSQAGVSAGKMAALASSQARDAEQAIANRDSGRAIEIAEAAVAADPANAAYRTLLGRAYLLSGRFASARTAFSDALTLGSTESRVIVNLALIDVAQGRKEQARTLLTDHMGSLPAADYGLAMAMAGDPQEAIRVLSQAIHDPAATAKERQNLAYAYALAGQWNEARLTASFDLPPLEAMKRVAGWAQNAQAGAESQRVIAMMGVSPRADDSGMPVRLALAPNAPAAAVEMASAANAAPVPSTEASDVPAPIDIPNAEPSPVQTAQAGSAPFPAAVSAPMPVADLPSPVTATDYAAVSAPPMLAATKPATRTKASAGAPLSPMLRPTPSVLLRAPSNKPSSVRPASAWQPVDPTSGSAWLVQLGAFSSQQNAKAAWARYVGRNSKLAQFPLVESQAQIAGRVLYRVAIAGFGDRTGAVQLCDRVRADGGACFVRLGGAEAAPARWAMAKKPRQLAMR